jgi:glutathione synthase/RimK-type ligase-like ATP-grasp enzyme
MEKQFLVAVGTDRIGWYHRFASALDHKVSAGYPLKYRLVNMQAHDWLSQVKDCDAVLWKPPHMGVRSSSYLKEQIYFLQYIVKKLVVPNYESVWHFESKIAQSYLFAFYQVPTPRTFVSFDYTDARKLVEEAGMPIVVKDSFGAGSSHVRLESKKERFVAKLKQIFYGQFWYEAKDGTSSHSKRAMILLNLGQRWMWLHLWDYLRGRPGEVGAVYFQEFVPGNPADLRITVIGDRYAYGFWRHNRPNDFRASGSGHIDYQKPIPEEPLRACIRLSRTLNLDTMCYDILFTPRGFVLTEMSYGYLDFAPFNCPGYYLLDKEGNLSFIPGHTWPQELWVEWLLHRMGIA